MKKRFLAVCMAALVAAAPWTRWGSGTGGEGGGGPYTITANSGDTLQTVFDGLPPRVISIGSGFTAGMVEITDNKLRQEFRTPTQGVTGDQLWVEADRIGSPTGNIRFWVETVNTSDMTEVGSAVTNCTSEYINTRAFSGTPYGDTAGRDIVNYATTRLYLPSSCTLTGDTIYAFVFEGDDLYDDGASACTAANKPDVCCTASGVGASCTKFATGTDAIRLVKNGFDSTPCATWTYGSGTAPGVTGTPDCGTRVLSGAVWGAASTTADLAFVFGRPSLVKINPGSYTGSVDFIATAGMLTIQGSDRATTWHVPMDETDATQDLYGMFFYKAFGVEIEHLVFQSPHWKATSLTDVASVPTVVQMRDVSDVKIHNNKSFGGSVFYDTYGASSLYHARHVESEYNEVHCSFVCVNVSMINLGKYISKHNRFYLSRAAEDSFGVHFAWVEACNGDSGTQNNSICVMDDNDYYITVPAGTNTSTVGLMCSTDYDGLCISRNPHVYIETNQDKDVYCYSMGNPPEQAGLSAQAGTEWNLYNPSCEVYMKNASSANAVGLECRACNQVYMKNPMFSFDAAGQEVPIEITTSGTVNVRGGSGIDPSKIVSAGTVVMSPTVQSATADGTSPDNVTVNGCAAGMMSACNSEEAAATCDVTDSNITAANTVQAAYTGCASSETITCKCETMP